MRLRFALLTLLVALAAVPAGTALGVTGNPADRLADLPIDDYAYDSAGNEDALARRMGIQEIIWNCHSWWSGSDGMGQYSACYTERGKRRKRINRTEAHMDHIHIGLSRAGARKRTSFWAR